jgi:tripartite ATP-independent transporter DctP family solute receptor
LKQEGRLEPYYINSTQKQGGLKMRSIKVLRRFFISVLCLFCLVVFLISGAEAAMKIRIATNALPEVNQYKGLERWKAMVEERSKGEINVTILGRAVMGGDREIIEGIRLGTLDACVTSGSLLGNIIPQWFIIPMPYLFNDHKEANAFLDGPIGDELFEMLEPKGIVGLGWATWAFRGIWNNVRPITKPEDLRGLKIRTLETTLDMSIMNLMGGVPTPMAWSEAVLGLRQGTVAGISTTYGIGYTLKLYDIAKFASRTKHFYESAPFLMSKKVFDKLTPAQQQLVKETGKEAMFWAREHQAQVDEGSKELLEKKGVKVNSLDKAAFEQFRQLTQPVYKQMRGIIGEDFTDKSLKFIDSLRK